MFLTATLCRLTITSAQCAHRTIGVVHSVAQKLSDQTVIKLIVRLKSQGYEVNPNAALRGKSGYEHTFDYLVLRRDGFMNLMIALEVIADAEDPETSLHKLFAFQDKCSDCSIKRSMVIAFPRLSFVASQFAQKDGVEVLDEATIQAFLARPPVSRAARKDAQTAFTQKTEVTQELKALGYRIDESVRVVGNSGTAHVFGAIAMWDDSFILSRLGIDYLSGDAFDEGVVTLFDDKCGDAGITERMLLVSGALTSDATKLAEQKRIQIVNLNGQRKDVISGIDSELKVTAATGSEPLSPASAPVVDSTLPTTGSDKHLEQEKAGSVGEGKDSKLPMLGKEATLPPVPAKGVVGQKNTETLAGANAKAEPAVPVGEQPSRPRAFSMRSVIDQFLLPQVRPKQPEKKTAPVNSKTAVPEDAMAAAKGEVAKPDAASGKPEVKVPEVKAVEAKVTAALEKPASAHAKAAETKVAETKLAEVKLSGDRLATAKLKPAEAKAVLVAERPDKAQIKVSETKTTEEKPSPKAVDVAKASKPAIDKGAQIKVSLPGMKTEVVPKQPAEEQVEKPGVVDKPTARASVATQSPKPVAEKPAVEKRPVPAAQAKSSVKQPEPPPPVVEQVVEKPKVKLRKAARPEALQLVSESTARRFSVLPISVADNVLEVAMVNPSDLATIQVLELQSKMRIKAVAADKKEILEAIDFNYKGFGQIAEQISHIDTGSDAASGPDLVAASANAPVAAALNLIVEEAVKARASDIHIEPEEKRLRIRYRIDGVLHEVMSLPVKIHPPLTSRVKVMSDLNIADHLRPQDGQFSLEVKGKLVDVRVATSPTIHGETVVMRLLDKSMAVMDLSQLGFTPESLEKYQKMLSVPFGMICVSGPTGAGKTTTLYASLNTMDKVTRNVITVEDPVEYRFEGMKQIQVNPKAGLTFANVLRSMMRLDPDVILVGEIRDAETAGIAVKAALTGHLVLCSIHANDAVSVVYRLLDLGVEPFMVASVITGTIAQRMARRICPNCAAEVKPTPVEAAAYESVIGEKLESFMSGSGCDFCSFSGYKGRLGLYEILATTDDTRALILKGATTSELRRQAIKDGMVTLNKDGMLKVKAGLTTVSEVLRNAYSIE